MPNESENVTQQKLSHAADEMKAHTRTISDHVRRSAGNFREEIESAAESAKEQIGEAGESITEGARAVVNEQKATRAEQLSGIAHAINLAADELRDELPQVSGYVREAASKVDNVSAMIRERNVEELVHDANDFARANAATFFGISLAAGFALTRFLKSRSPAERRRLTVPDYSPPRPERTSTNALADKWAEYSAE